MEILAPVEVESQVTTGILTAGFAQVVAAVGADLAWVYDNVTAREARASRNEFGFSVTNQVVRPAPPGSAVQVTATGQLTPAGTADEITVGTPWAASFWVFDNGSTSNAFALRQLKSSNGTPVTIVWGPSSGNQALFVGQWNSGCVTAGVPKSTYAQNTWHHVVVQYNGGVITAGSSWSVWINNSNLSLSDGIPGSFTTGTNVSAFAFSGTPTGRIDDWREWTDKTLTSAERSDLWASGNGTSANVVGGERNWWGFDENTGTTAANAGSSGNAITRSGGSTWQTGKVAGSPSVVTADLLLSENGINPGEEGILTVGDAQGRLVLNGSTFEFSSASTFRSGLGAAASGANTDITSLYLNNTGLKLRDIDGSHGLIIRTNSDFTADRTLIFTINNGDRVIALGGNLQLSNSFQTTGNFGLIFNQTANTNATMPPGIVTLVGTTTTQSLTNKSVQFQAGGTALNHYAEGNITTFTLTTTGTPGTVTYTTRNARWVRVGRLVTVTVDLTISNWTGSPSGNVFISGAVPSSPPNEGAGGAIGLFQGVTFSAGYTQLTCIVNTLGNIVLFEGGSGVGVQNIPASRISTSFRLQATFSYLAT